MAVNIDCIIEWTKAKWFLKSRNEAQSGRYQPSASWQYLTLPNSQPIKNGSVEHRWSWSVPSLLNKPSKLEATKLANTNNLSVFTYKDWGLLPHLSVFVPQTICQQHTLFSSVKLRNVSLTFLLHSADKRVKQWILPPIWHVREKINPFWMGTTHLGEHSSSILASLNQMERNLESVRYWSNSIDVETKKQQNVSFHPCCLSWSLFHLYSN